MGKLSRQGSGLSTMQAAKDVTLFQQRPAPVAVRIQAPLRVRSIRQRLAPSSRAGVGGLSDNSGLEKKMSSFSDNQKYGQGRAAGISNWNPLLKRGSQLLNVAKAGVNSITNEELVLQRATVRSPRASPALSNTTSR